jgi:hypothetical protein
MIGSAKGIETVSGRATWSTCKGRATTDWKALESSIPEELIQQHTRIGASYRRFTFKPKEG